MSGEARFRIYLCAGPHCTIHGRAAIERALEAALWDARLTDAVELRASGCQSRCDFAPNLTIWPGPFHYQRLTPETIRRIVAEHLVQGRPVEDLLPRA